MIEDIVRILESAAGLKAKKISKELGVSSSAVNAVLYGNSDRFSKDEDHRWFLKTRTGMAIEFPENTWIDAELFEDYLSAAGSPLDGPVDSLRIVVPSGCSLLLDAAIRLLALCNQVVAIGSSVEIDFSNSRETTKWLGRVGFHDFLDQRVVLIPGRPPISGAKTYRGNNAKVHEFERIVPSSLDDEIPKRLKACFVEHAGEEGSNAAFTFIAELFENVVEHSKTTTPGFVGLHKYHGREPHLQTVVSDNGIGILGSLGPTLAVHYPTLANKYDLSNPDHQIALVKKMLTKGEISSAGKGKGLGLKKATDAARTFRADLSIRQENFSVTLSFRNGVLSQRSRKGLSLIRGTHVCFDFLLDGPTRSG